MSPVKNRVRGRVESKVAKNSISKMAFRVGYLRKSRQVHRHMMDTKPWLSQLYTSFLGIRPGLRIVDVGCGPGDFTRYIAKLSKGKARVLGIDANKKAIQAAIVDTKKAGLSRSITFEVGDVYDIPVEDRFADLTCCRSLLIHLTDPVRAVREMARITKVGGTVAAVETGRMGAFYDPENEKFSRLSERADDAIINGIRKLEGKEIRIGERLPGLFQKAGLSEIKAEIQSDAWLNSDPRRDFKDVKTDVRFQYEIFKERREKDRMYYEAGGMTNAQINAYNRIFDVRTRALLKDDRKLRSDSTFAAVTRILVSGVKR